MTPMSYPPPAVPARPWRIPAPAGTPYHRLAATDAHRWWRPLLGTGTVLVSFLAAQVALIIVFMIVAFVLDAPRDADGLPVLPALAETAYALLGIATGLPLVLVAAWLIQRRSPGSVSSVVGRIRWSWLGRCLLIALPVVVLLLAGTYGLTALTGADTGVDDVEWVGVGMFVTSAAMLLALVPLQAAAEEYLCRGWLLQAVGAYLRGPWPAIVVQAVPFALAHGWGTTWGFLDLLLFAVVTGWLTVRTGGLEAAVALHVVNNLVAMLLAGALGQLTIEQTATDAPWQMLVVDAPLLIGYAIVVAWLAGRRGLARTTPAPAPTFAPPWPPAAGPPPLPTITAVGDSASR
ncbi:type II CAAX endopeptidase family protein [Solwaraspora sp. WMMD791]|uniref:CPBP family intramembrane glutamic endopeptidase n=1 Tax=Solwaraspora sp. WMMD791 TaxID=3016086 RepID=UPI00249B6029|nr:type II CAAX endopeptidase family protein [Solwaraspora sp. WMMD791]WFE28415.1 type II CAAX endopeptidase family protein [Solwaraspora sp. WMMD791]